MAGRRLRGAAAVLAVVLLVCLSSAPVRAADDGNIDDALIEALKPQVLGSKLATAGDVKSAFDIVEAGGKTAAGVSEPQHAPQFPEEPSLTRGDKQQQPSKVETPAPAAPVQKDAPKQEEKEDPCKRVPGCMECRTADKATHSRRLKQFAKGGVDNDWNLGSVGSLGTGSSGGKKNKPDLNFMDFADSPYNAKDLPFCSVCNTTGGYVTHTKGRCACAPGYGDSTPTGNCHKCPGGFFSQGGFRAVCAECEGVAFSNADRTACVCASGWYGVTSYATKQASCNQCPGARPVSPEGARSASECKVCPEGQRANEIFSECVDPSSIPPPEKETPVPTNGTAPATEGPAPATVKPLFNESTFEHTKEEWTITTRNTQNHTNLISDILGNIMDSVVMGKNITSTAARPGDLLYQVLTKPTPSTPKLPNLPNIDMQNPAQIGAGVGAALSAVPAVLGAAAQKGGKISDVVDSVVKAVETGSKTVGADPAAATGNGWQDFLKGLTATAPKDNSGKSEYAEFAKSLGDLFGAAGKVASEVAEKSDNGLVKSFSSLLSAAKKGDVEVPVADTPEIAKADSGSSWSNMLQGLMGGQAAAPAPAPAPANSAGDWSKLLGSLAKGTAAPAADAAAPSSTSAAPSTGGINNMQQLISGLAAAQHPGSPTTSADLAKMLASLTGPAARKVADPTKTPHTITAVGINSGASDIYKPPVQALSSSSVPTNAPSAGMPNLLQALSQLGSPATTTTTNADLTHESTQKVWNGNSGSGGLGGLLGGLFGNNKASNTFSFANPGGAKLQARPQSVPGNGFISVPSAPPKGSSAIKSGKVGSKPGQGKAKQGKKQ